jgi:iron complex outermembrane receptor protein
MRTRLATLLIMGGAVLAGPAAHAADSATTIDELVVTAEKREESLQKVPIAISAYSGDTLAKVNVDSVNQLQHLAPSVYFGRQDGQALISIRGIGSNIVAPGADSGVAVHLDGVYISKQQAQDAAMFDIERVEVLRGPQGTVNGRNATGGSINVISRRPTDEFGGYLNVTVGNYAAIKTQGAVGGPLFGDKVLWRVAFRTDNRDGYTPNQAFPDAAELDDANQQSVRGSLLIRWSDRIEQLLTVDYDRVDTNGFATIIRRTAAGAPIPGTLIGGKLSTGRAVNADGRTGYQRETYGVTSNTRIRFDGFSLTSIGGYRRLDDQVFMDVDGTNAPLLHDNLHIPQWQVSQELNLTSDGEGPWSWLVGAYYFHELQRPDQKFARPGVSVLTVGGVARTTSYAGYAQVSWQATEALRLTAGGRYTYDRKKAFEFLEFRPFGIFIPGNLKDSWSAFTPKVSADYQLAPGKMVYATISRGFRSGGINVGNVQGSTFDPEFVWNYEAGFKGVFWDGRLQANLAAFHYDYTDIQLYNIRTQTGIVENAAAATINGVELETVLRPGGGWRLEFAGSYVDATLDKYDTIEPSRPAAGRQSFDGNTLTRAPKWKANAAVEKGWDAFGGTASVRAEYSYTGLVNFTEFNRPETQQKPVSLWNARASWETAGGKYRVIAFVENLTDEDYNSTVLVGSAGTNFSILEYPAPPRTFGVQVYTKF